MNTYQASKLYMEKRAWGGAAVQALLRAGKYGLPALQRLGPAFKGKSLAQIGSAAKRQLSGAWQGFGQMRGGLKQMAGRRTSGHNIANLRRQLREAKDPAVRAQLTKTLADARAAHAAMPAVNLRPAADLLQQNAFGSLALTGAGTGLAYGGAQGLGYGAGLATGDRSGQRQIDSLQGLGFGDRAQALFNPQAFAQAQAQRLAATRTQPNNWTRFLPGVGGMQAGRRRFEGLADQQFANMLPQAGLGARAAYTFAPNRTLDMARQHMGVGQ